MAYRIRGKVVLVGLIDGDALEAAASEGIGIAKVRTRLGMRISAHLVLATKVTKIRDLVHIDPHAIVVYFLVKLLDLRRPVLLYYHTLH